MLCAKCSTELPDDAVACYRCGTMTGLTYVTSPKPPVPSVPWPWIATIVGIAILLIGVVVLIAVIVTTSIIRNNEVAKADPPAQPTKNIPAANAPSTRNAPAAPPVEKTPTSEKDKTLIVNDQFPVGARAYNDFEFTVNTPSRVTGGFRAFGGNDDIDAMLVDDDNFAFVHNGLDAKVLYHTGYTSRGKINLNLSPGRYHLVFDNRKALLTGKSVAAEIYVEAQ